MATEALHSRQHSRRKILLTGTEMIVGGFALASSVASHIDNQNDNEIVNANSQIASEFLSDPDVTYFNEEADTILFLEGQQPSESWGLWHRTQALALKEATRRAHEEFLVTPLETIQVINQINNTYRVMYDMQVEQKETQEMTDFIGNENVMNALLGLQTAAAVDNIRLNQQKAKVPDNRHIDNITRRQLLTSGARISGLASIIFGLGNLGARLTQVPETSPTYRNIPVPILESLQSSYSFDMTKSLLRNKLNPDKYRHEYNLYPRIEYDKRRNDIIYRYNELNNETTDIATKSLLNERIEHAAESTYDAYADRLSYLHNTEIIGLQRLLNASLDSPLLTYSENDPQTAERYGFGLSVLQDVEDTQRIKHNLPLLLISI